MLVIELSSLELTQTTGSCEETNRVSNNNLADILGVLRRLLNSSDDLEDRYGQSLNLCTLCNICTTSRFKPWCPGYVHQEIIVEHVAGNPERTSRMWEQSIIVLKYSIMRHWPGGDLQFQKLNVAMGHDPKSHYISERM